MKRGTLKRIIAARRSEKAKAEAKAERSRAEPDDDKNNVKYYSPDFKVSDRGVFARELDDNGHPIWDEICTTRNRSRGPYQRRPRGELGHLYYHHKPRLAEEKAGSPSRPYPCRQSRGHLRPTGLARRRNRSITPARQLLVQFLTLDVSRRITAVPQIGWHCSGEKWLFVLPDDTIVPAGFDGPRPVLQTASLHVQHGLDVSGISEQWIEQIARPMAGTAT